MSRNQSSVTASLELTGIPLWMSFIISLEIFVVDKNACRNNEKNALMYRENCIDVTRMLDLVNTKMKVTVNSYILAFVTLPGICIVKGNYK